MLCVLQYKTGPQFIENDLLKYQWYLWSSIKEWSISWSFKTNLIVGNLDSQWITCLEYSELVLNYIHTVQSVNHNILSLIRFWEYLQKMNWNIWLRRQCLQMHLNEYFWNTNHLLLEYVPQTPIDNNSALVQVAWHQTCTKPLPESKLTNVTVITLDTRRASPIPTSPVVN